MIRWWGTSPGSVRKMMGHLPRVCEEDDGAPPQCLWGTAVVVPPECAGRHLRSLKSLSVSHTRRRWDTMKLGCMSLAWHTAVPLIPKTTPWVSQHLSVWPPVFAQHAYGSCFHGNCRLMPSAENHFPMPLLLTWERTNLSLIQSSQFIAQIVNSSFSLWQYNMPGAESFCLINKETKDVVTGTIGGSGVVLRPQVHRQLLVWQNIRQQLKTDPKKTVKSLTTTLLWLDHYKLIHWLVNTDTRTLTWRHI